MTQTATKTKFRLSPLHYGLIGAIEFFVPNFPTFLFVQPIVIPPFRIVILAVGTVVCFMAAYLSAKFGA